MSIMVDKKKMSLNLFPFLIRKASTHDTYLNRCERERKREMNKNEEENMEIGRRRRRKNEANEENRSG
jgi:hypothetical protein